MIKMIYLDDQSFYYKDDVLYIDSINSFDIVSEVDTPFYCYSKNSIERNYLEFSNNLPPDTLICYAVKANSNLAIIKLLSRLGAGAEVVSEGEIRKAMMADIPADKIVFSGVGKTESEINYALDCNILQFNVESIEELRLISEIASSKNIVANVSLRINPNINAETNHKITTGLKSNKFGIAEENIAHIFDHDISGVNIMGVSVHIGSQISDLDIFDAMIIKIKKIIDTLTKEYNCEIKNVDLGGGLGISYTKDQIFPTISEYSQLVKDHFLGSNYNLICEPGRSLVGNSGVLFTEVLYCKSNDQIKHVVVDAGMNDFMRTALYDSYHTIVPILRKNDVEDEVFDIVGPVCESDDIFAHNINMQKVSKGDILAICTTGAYGSSMYNNYNSRPLISEVLVEDDKFRTIRKRQTYAEMFDQEINI